MSNENASKGWVMVESRTLNGTRIIVRRDDYTGPLPPGYAVYTAREAESMLDMSPAQIQAIHAVKLAFPDKSNP